MKRLFVLVGVTVPLMVSAGCGSNSSGSGTGGHGGTGTGGAGTGGAGTGGVDGGAPDSAPRDAAAGGSGGSAGGSGTGGSAGSGGGGVVGPTLAQLCAPAAGGAVGAGGGAGGAAAGLAFVNQTYTGDGRVVPSEAVFGFINTIDDPHAQTLRLHNGGTSAVQITSLQIVGNTAAPAANAPATPGTAGGTLFPLTYNQVSIPAAFKITPSMTIPVTLAAGADLDVSVQFLSTKTNPPDRMLNIGGQAVSAVLVAQADGRCVPAGLYGVSLWNNTETAPDATTGLPSNNWARYEPTFGQIVATLGYKVNLGAAFIQLLNTNDMSIPSVGLSTEEVQVHKFVKADANAPVQLLTVGRFSPPTDIPYGWYPTGSLTGTPATGGAGGAGGAGGGGAAGGGGRGRTDGDRDRRAAGGDSVWFDPGGDAAIAASGRCHDARQPTGRGLEHVELQRAGVAALERRLHRHHIRSRRDDSLRHLGLHEPKDDRRAQFGRGSDTERRQRGLRLLGGRAERRWRAQSPLARLSAEKSRGRSGSEQLSAGLGGSDQRRLPGLRLRAEERQSGALKPERRSRDLNVDELPLDPLRP